MNEEEVWELFSERLGDLSADEEYELRDPDYVMEMPKSGERIRGRDKLRAMQDAFPAPPSNLRMRRMVGSADIWVVEGSGDWSGRMYHVANIVEFREGKILRETRYYADPFEPPALARGVGRED
jgi:SnoaL-like domain